MVYWISLLHIWTWAGLECHPNEIQKALDALVAIKKSKCSSSADFREAAHRLRELKHESSCNQRVLNEANELLTRARIDPLLGVDIDHCATSVDKSIQLIQQLAPTKKSR